MEPHQASKETPPPQDKTKVIDRSNMDEVSMEQKGKETPLQYKSTAQTEEHFKATVTQNGKPVLDYDINSGNLIPKMDCIKDLEPRVSDDKANLADKLYLKMKEHNHTEGIHTMERLLSCVWNNDGNIRGYEQYSYDGDVNNLDQGNQTGTAATDKALNTKQRNGYTMSHDLEDFCNALWKCVNYTTGTRKWKVPGGGPEGVPIGIIIGVVAVLALVGIVAVIFYKKKKKKKSIFIRARSRAVIILGSDGGSGSSAV